MSMPTRGMNKCPMVYGAPGDDIFHYTKVTYYMRDGQEGVESDKEWGTGKVPAHTEETYKHTVVRVFYGIS